VEAYGARCPWPGRQWRGTLLGRGDAVLFPRPLAYAEFRARPLTTGAVMADQFHLMIPMDIATGRYALYVAPGGYPTEGNLGLKLGTVEIVPRRLGSETALMIESGARSRPPGPNGHEDRKRATGEKYLPGKTARNSALDHALVVGSEADQQQGER